MTAAFTPAPATDHREVTLHGHRLSYRIAGEGPVILLVHGIAGSALTWTATQRELARHFTVIAPDLPGHGVSDKPPADYSLGSLASALRDLLVALGHERATIVGHSLGGGIAMQFAYQFPERCERLVLVSSGGLGRDVSVILRAACLPGADLFLAGAAAPLVSAGGRVARGLARLGWRPAPDLEEVARGFSSLADAETRAAFLHTLRAVVGMSGQRVDASDRLYLTAEMPTLLLWGERDPIIPAHHAQAAHERMPGSRLVTFPRSGHMPHLDEPQRFSEALLEFIATTEPAHVSAKRWQAMLRSGGPPAHPPAGAKDAKPGEPVRESGPRTPRTQASRPARSSRTAGAAGAAGAPPSTRPAKRKLSPRVPAR